MKLTVMVMVMVDVVMVTVLVVVRLTELSLGNDDSSQPVQVDFSFPTQVRQGKETEDEISIHGCMVREHTPQFVEKRH